MKRGRKLARKIVNWTRSCLTTEEFQAIGLKMTRAQCEDVATLFIDNCRLTHVPLCVSRFRFLRSLHLEDNLFSSLPSELQQLTELETFWLDNNLFTKLPSWLGNFPQLSYLRVNTNLLKSLPVSLGRLTTLIQIDTHRNPDLPEQRQFASCDSTPTQEWLRPFRCALKCQSVVVTLLGTYRRANRFRMPRDMVRYLSTAIWKTREDPTWSE